MATRATLLVVLLAGCSAPVGFSSLREQVLVFAGQRNGENVSGELFFGRLLGPGGEGSPGGACFTLDPAIAVTLNTGNQLARGSGRCLPNGISDRWLVPEVRSLESEDLNVVFADGTNVARAVIPGALAAPQTTLTEIVFLRAEPTSVLLGFPSDRIELSYAGTDGTTWSAPVSAGWLTPPQGSGSGAVTITGTALFEGSSCRGFAGCRGETPFRLSVPARYQ
jgi:hypothetical protein